MIIWGGYGVTPTYKNDGGRYNPSTDTWMPTSTGTNVPSARRYHTAVWTGAEMIVWAGDNGGYPNTGGRYNPSTDAWIPTSIGGNVPAPRYYHTAVWSGTEMVVWGGYNGMYLNTGGRYSPSSDSWTFTSTGTDVPAGRRYHTALWTGTQMLVWGGDNGSYFNTGGLYSPASDTWTPTSTVANCPVPRSSHTAIWTGSEMIVWGGTNGSYLASGGGYNPTLSCYCTANAGSPQTGLVGQAVTLNGSASSCTTGSPTAYLWTMASTPSGSTATITNANSVIASVTPDLAGVYSVFLAVSNANGVSTPAMTSVMTSSCSQALSVYPARPSPEPLEAVTFTARGGSGSYAWMLTQNNTGASLAASGSTCVYTAGTAQGTDILRLTDATCGTSASVTINVQGLAPQITSGRFCPAPTNGATTTTLYATFSATVNAAEYMKLPAGAWTPMTGSGKNWQAAVAVSNPTAARCDGYAARGFVTGGSGRTPQVQYSLYVTPSNTPILLIHGWSFSPQCINDCGNFDSSRPSEQLLKNRLVSDGYDARIVTGIDSWGELADNAAALKTYIDNQGMQGTAIVLVGYSYGGLISREFLAKYPTYAANVKEVITVDTPHTGSPAADKILDTGIRNSSDKALKWLTERYESQRGAIQVTDVPFYEIGSWRRNPNSVRQFLFDWIGRNHAHSGLHDEVVPLASQWGYQGSNGSSASRKAYASSQPCPSNVSRVLHGQVLGDGGSSEFNAFYTDAFQPVIQKVLTASCTGLMEAPSRQDAHEAQTIPSATQARALISLSGTAMVGVEATATVTVETTLQGTFGVSLSNGTGQVWLTDPTSTLINPAAANGDSIKYDFTSDSETEQHIYTLRSPAAGVWTVHVLPSATILVGLSYTMNAQNLSTLGMSASTSPTELLPGDAVVVSATLLKAAAPLTGASATATLTLPDGANAWLTLYDDGLHQDGAASDGVYANYYTAGTQNGQVMVAVDASGTDGSLGAWQRVANTSFAVGRQVGTFTGVYSESAPDADLNGKLDALVITAGVSVTEIGDYQVIGDLKDQAGNMCSSASGTFAESAPGVFSVALSFRGQDIFENSALGPYTLTKLRLYQSGTAFSLSDRKNNAYTTTGSYPSWTSFESKDVPLFQFVKPVSDEVILGNSSTIQWKTGDGFANAVISLYYDATGTGFAGTPITGAQRLRKDDPAKSFAWDMTALPEGKYFVYALIQDGSFSDALYGGSIYKTLDTDGDGMPNSWETAHALDLNNAADSLLDPDADGLNNMQEYQASTDPFVADTDGGGEKDGSEVFNGRNPLVGTDDAVAIQLTQVTPSAGATAGGQVIQLRGIHFLAGATVNFGGTDGTSVQVMDGQNLLVTTPARAQGTVNVNVVNPGGATGTLVGGFTYQSAPGLGGALPGTVPTHGGTTVTLAGSGFSAPMRVLFGNSEGSSVTVGSASSMTAVTPVISAGVLNVTALNQGYQSATLSGAMTAVDIPPVEVSRLNVLKTGSMPALSWTTVTQAADGYIIQPTQYSVYRAESLPVPKDLAHRVAAPAGGITSWIDASSGTVEYYLITASYQSAEGP